MCAGPTSCQFKPTDCPFLTEYSNYLKSIDFSDYLLPELIRIATDAKKLLGFTEDPHIVLLVHEKPDNPCSERNALIDLFKQYNIKLKE